MVDLPTVGNQIVTSTAPQSSVSRGDIQQNADLMANAMSKVADTTMDIATDMAKKQAADDLQNQKVTLNADGSVNIVNPANSVIFGRAGEAYGAAVQAGTIAQHSNVISQEMNDIHQKYPTDPAGFNAAANAWKARYTADHGGGEVGLAIQQQADQLQTQHFNAITNTAANLDLTRQHGALTATQTSAQDDVLAMLRGGASLADPAVQSRLAQVDAAISARAANPLFGYSKEQADFDRQTFHSEAGASRWLYDVDSTYKNQGYAGAMAKAQDILVNPAYQLSQPQREAYFHKATADIRANEALRHQDVAEARASFNDLSMVSAAGGEVSSDMVEHVADSARKAGDPGLAAAVYSSFIRKPLNDSFGQQPLAEQTKQLAALHGANAITFVNSALIAKGYSPIAAAGIVGNVVHESGVDPTAVGDNGTSGGLAQWHNERLTALKAFAAAQGKPVSDLQTQVDFIDHELHTTEAGTLAKLQAATTPEDAAGAFIDYERPQGWTQQNPAAGLGYESRRALARQIFNGRPADMSMGPAGSMWLEANRARTLGTAAYTQWQTIMKDYRESGSRPPLQLANDIVNAARVARDPALLDTIAHDSEVMDLAGQSARAPLVVQQSNITDLTAAGNAGRLSPGNSQLITDLQRRYNAINTGLNENPIATTVANFPDKVKDPGPLDVSSAQGLAAGLAARSRIAKFGAQNWQTAPLSVLDKQDVGQVQAALQGPNGPDVLAGLSSGLQPQDLTTLFDKTKLADSITGMSRSGDQAKMNAAFSFMDSLQRQNPMQFNKQFPDGLRDLRAWQSMISFYTPDALAKKMETLNLPQEIEARKASDDVADEALKNVSPDKVVSKFSTGWPLIGTTANAPAGEAPAMAAGALKADYDANYREGFAVSRDATMADQYAMERLKMKYAVSPTNNNRVMAYAPENPAYYPMVNGSYDWIAKQLDQEVANALGVEQSPRRSYPNAYEARQQGGRSAADITPFSKIIEAGNNPARNFYSALTDLHLTPEEQNLFKIHQSNVTGPGGVSSPDGSRLTLAAIPQEHDGRYYSIPTVWGGKVLTDVAPNADESGLAAKPSQQALEHVERVGWDKFPSYATPEAAAARYQQMQPYMDRDVKYAEDRRSIVGQRQYAAPRALVSDPTTQSDIAQGRPPSYQVILQDPNGRWGMMMGQNGRPARIRFDPSQPYHDEAVQAYRKRDIVNSPIDSTMAIAG
ncbi:phage tail tip lysozyme [Bradyrhizobium sp. dw_78]|uniref:phage tail tip lysozyme n=1 Tax=Bradyrhizobium sp. dw_78 TaxID=2719793 RepID=UPI001BD4AC9B|nr:phage tail tip lysozyme [Bradyrhizobium sp. dw_78]